MACEARKNVLSPFNKFNLTTLESPVFCTPPMNPFVEDELQLNDKETGIIVSIKLSILLQLIECSLIKSFFIVPCVPGVFARSHLGSESSKLIALLREPAEDTR